MSIKGLALAAAVAVLGAGLAGCVDDGPYYGGYAYSSYYGPAYYGPGYYDSYYGPYYGGVVYGGYYGGHRRHHYYDRRHYRSDGDDHHRYSRSSYRGHVSYDGRSSYQSNVVVRRGGRHGRNEERHP